MEEKIKTALEALRENPHHKLLWPEATSFLELFYDIREVEDLSKYKSTEAHVFSVSDPYRKGKKGRATISSYCSVQGHGGHRSYDLKPYGRTIELVEEHMLLVPDYRINFQVNAYEDGTALISAQYNQITGSRWFTFIDSSTLP